ncbi:uncharacterized protein LOC132044496 [Lycium ferocissimum]|uniref:uncharacterized protein LOC132044496 n=1 Tax=Lycium ferocissimum TaxID=112874 RepID=UPI0028158D94|nr:uncharacterized protein LOC132044496 [Lycium ferocissimum]
MRRNRGVSQKQQREEQKGNIEEQSKGKVNQKEKEAGKYKNFEKPMHRGYHNSARLLSSGRLIGNPGQWNPVKDNRKHNHAEGNGSQNMQGEQDHLEEIVTKKTAKHHCLEKEIAENLPEEGNKQQSQHDEGNLNGQTEEKEDTNISNNSQNAADNENIQSPKGKKEQDKTVQESSKDWVEASFGKINVDNEKQLTSQQGQQEQNRGDNQVVDQVVEVDQTPNVHEAR